jgi:HemY protein
VRCQLWGKARSYIEESIKLDPTAEAYREQGMLFEQLGAQSAALESYRKGCSLK